MQDVLDQRPDAEASDPVGSKTNSGKSLTGEVGAVGDGRHPNGRYNPPGRLAQGLEEVAEQRGAVSTLVVTGTVDLFKVKILGETTPPYLHQERLVEVEELVCAVIR